ncbi:MAG: CsgG/HfaB family protein [Treponema sp.]|jgi:TolB-like protein|nr:CsgG/HfaB family protein [Treponema sp.]
MKKRFFSAVIAVTRGYRRGYIGMRKTLMVCMAIMCIPAFAFSQTTATLDKALNDSTVYLKGRLLPKTKVVILNFVSDWPKLSDYIIEELIGYIVNEGTFTVVDRNNLEIIRRELNFQLSGEVSDETAQSIGKKLGAQTIISGAITTIGNVYRLRIRAISVETAQIQGMQNVDVVQDSRLAALTGTAYAGPVNVTTNTHRATTTVNTSPSNADYLILATAEWEPNTDPKSTVSFTVNRENIDGREREVLNVNQKLASGIPAWAEVFTRNEALAQKLTRSSGIRFKVLGDGKGWQLLLPMKETDADSAFHRAAIATKKDRVVEIDIPYAQLKQPSWGKRAAFNKNNIIGLYFVRNNDSPGGAGNSTIKIFDIEIY